MTTSSFTRTALIALALFVTMHGGICRADQLLAGAASVDITDRKGVLHVNDPLYAKALVLKNDHTSLAIITVDAVALGEIGYIGNDYVPRLRARLEKELDIKADHVLVNASHCHGVVCGDVLERTFQAVKQAVKNMVPVQVGVGTGHEDRVMENRRLKLKDSTTADVRHAYSLPPSAEIAEVGPVDPTIGILRLNAKDGRTVAVVYNFAMHPIQGVPNGGNTADVTGFASRVIEDNLSEGAIALFVQGCAGDINPATYKDVNNPRDAETLGNLLGLSTLKALRNIPTKSDARLTVFSEGISLPRADTAGRIARLEALQQKLVASMRGTSLNFETFLPLYVKYKVSGDFPSYYSHRYLHEEKLGRDHLKKLDADNERNMKAYLNNIITMERLTRVQTNLALLRRHQSRNEAAKSRTLDVEMLGVRIGDFVLVTFPGELTVQIGLNIKKASPHKHTFVAGYTNGYIFYAPTAEQLRNAGAAQEDSDCLLAPEWQAIYEARVMRLLKKL